jgi:GrpB-like predicted nucleotidyltransferase (UPF0157 family)
VGERSFELVGGPEPGRLRVVAYDSAWPVRFRIVRGRLAAALGPLARRIDHVGSTSVPGLHAKPIIDVQVVLDGVAVEDEAAYAPHLGAAGFGLRVREEGHRMFRTPGRGVHLHLWADPGDVRRHLLFVAWLREDPDDLAAYAALKRQLAQREWPSMDDYAQAKGPLIAAIGERAEAWAERTGWTA